MRLVEAASSSRQLEGAAEEEGGGEGEAGIRPGGRGSESVLKPGNTVQEILGEKVREK